MEEYNHFDILLMYPRHKKLAREVYNQLPKKVKKIIEKYHIHFRDTRCCSKMPNSKVDKEPLGIYHLKEEIIDIIPKGNVFSDLAIKGIMVHEIAHGIINHSFCPIIKEIFRIKFDMLPNYSKHFYISSEDMHANWLAKKWGFKKEIDALNEERVIKKAG